MFCLYQIALYLLLMKLWNKLYLYNVLFFTPCVKKLLMQICKSFSWPHMGTGVFLVSSSSSSQHLLIFCLRRPLLRLQVWSGTRQLLVLLHSDKGLGEQVTLSLLVTLPRGSQNHAADSARLMKRSTFLHSAASYPRHSLKNTLQDNAVANLLSCWSFGF